MPPTMTLDFYLAGHSLFVFRILQLFVVFLYTPETNCPLSVLILKSKKEIFPSILVF